MKLRFEPLGLIFCNYCAKPRVRKIKILLRHCDDSDQEWREFIDEDDSKAKQCTPTCD